MPFNLDYVTTFGPVFGPVFGEGKERHGFTPLDIPNLRMWYDPSDLDTVTVDGGSVSVTSVADKSTNVNGQPLVQAQTNARPHSGTDTINGLNALKFDGENDRLTAAQTSLTSSFTFFMIVSPSKANDITSSALSFDTAPNFQISAQPAGQFRAFFDDTGMGVGVVIDDNQLGLDVLIGYVVDFDAGTVELRVNGVEVDSASDYTTEFGATQGMAIGSSDDNGEHLGMRFGEFVWYERTLTQNEIDRLESYLLTKWISTPPDIPDLAQWWDASALDKYVINTTDADSIESLASRLATGGTTLNQPTKANQPLEPTNTIDDYTVINFIAGSEQFFQSSGSLTLTKDHTAFIVGIGLSGASSQNSWFSLDATGTQSEYRIDAGTGAVFLAAVFTSGLDIDIAMRSDHDLSFTEFLASLVLDFDNETSSYRISPRSEVVQNPTSTYGGTGLADADLHIAVDESEVSFLSITFAEMLIYNRNLDETEVLKVENYLRAKWFPNLTSPFQIVNLLGWWDASDESTITIGTGGVSSWADKSGFGEDLAQASNPDRPQSGVDTMNDLNVLSFNGTSDFLTTASAINFANTSSTLFVVFRPTGVSDSDDGLLVFEQGLDHLKIIAAAPTSTFDSLVVQNGLGFAQTLNSGNVLNEDTLLGLNLSSSTTDVVLSVNGVPVDSVDSYNGAFNMAWDFSVGVDDTGEHLEMIVSEIVLYNRSLTLQETTDIQFYLTQKWGIT